MSTACSDETIGFLRGEENPFDAFVVPDKPAHEFAPCHVPELHGEEFTQICRVIDKYREPDYRSRRQLPDTRLLLVRGVRGSGKTHLLHVLRQRDTATPELWVCPRYFDPAFPFNEYLLSELVRAMLASDEAEAPARLGWCARQVGRRLLDEALGSLNPCQWQEWSRQGRIGRRAMRVSPSRQRDELREQLAGTGRSDQPLAAVCAQRGFAPAVAQALVIRHVEQTEKGTGVAARMRREVLLAFSDSAFGDDSRHIASLLEHDFAQDEAVLPPARAEIVTVMLQTLAEILSAVGVPILFAFDNIERLLAPKGAVDERTAQSFFNGMAHLIDQTRGLLGILFVEHGLWNALAPSINTFAEHRLRLGVRVRDYGCIWDLELKPPTAEQIGQVVQRRMQPLLARAPRGGQVPAFFPFQAAEVRQIATEGVDVLRTALLRLRDRYDAIVLPDGQLSVSGSGTEPSVAAEIDPSQTADALQRDWEEALAAARRRLQAARRTTLSPELHAGFGRWLELLVGREVRGWQLGDVRSAVTYGEHPTFGVVTLAHWTRAGATRRVALGAILGAGRSMPKDLEIKLAIFTQRPPIADELAVFWPSADGSIQPAQLPAATRHVWEQHAPQHPVSLAPLPLSDFAWLLGFPEWISAHASATPPDELQAFVAQRTEYLLADCAPHQPAEESP